MSNTTNPITRTSKRIFDFANDILTNLDIKPNGQEGLHYLRYEGDLTSPGKYEPHIDYISTIDHQFKPKTRMATMILYCSENIHNYKTNFQNIGIQVKPEQYSAIFISYINPETFVMDGSINGIPYSLKRSCPLYEGSMDLITQYIRYGVDDDTPWSD